MDIVRNLKWNINRDTAIIFCTSLLFINACINIKNYEKGKTLIDSIKDDNLNNHNIEFITSLIDFYGKISDSKQALINNLPSNKWMYIIIIINMIKL